MEVPFFFSSRKRSKSRYTVFLQPQQIPIMKYSTFLLISSTLLLSACQVSPAGMSVNLGIGSSIGSHIGVGTSVNIPVRFQPSAAQGGIRVIEEQIVTYFDAHGRPQEHAVKGGFYRQLISKRSQNEYLVQDFYADGGKKRTDPMILPRAVLFEFNAHPIDGTLTLYSHNGTFMRQTVYQNNRLIRAQY